MIDLINFFAVFPKIEMEDITLREIRLTDTEAFFKYINHPEVKRYLSESDSPKTMEKAHEELGYWGKLFKYRHSVYWAIADNKNDELIGTCGYNNWNLCHRRAEISYDLSYKYWGRGLMTKIINAMCEFSFTQMQTNRIQATVVGENIASIKVLEKNNFRQEGVLKQFGIIHGKKLDSYMYALLRDDSRFRE